VFPSAPRAFNAFEIVAFLQIGLESIWKEAAKTLGIPTQSLKSKFIFSGTKKFNFSGTKNSIFREPENQFFEN
jgi:hypothetical protein